MDYLVIGSNGFAQVGQADFHRKNKAEMAVLMNYLETCNPVPEEFSTVCWYRVKWFRHDFGDYSEIVLVYDDQLVSQWEESDPEKFDKFWDWFNLIESLDLESDALTVEIESRYHNLLFGTELTLGVYENKAS